MHSLYRIVVGASQYVQSAVKLMMKTVSYQWVHLACLVVFAILIATTCNHGWSLYIGAKWEEKYSGNGECTYVKLLNNLYNINKILTNYIMIFS